MKFKILIHTPNLSTPGGKQNYYTALKDKFEQEVTYFYYGPQGKKENKFQTISRLLVDYRKFYRQLKQEKYDLVLLNPSFTR